jgi:hypothetical protein
MVQPTATGGHLMAEIEKDTLRTAMIDATSEDTAGGMIQKVLEKFDLNLKALQGIDQKELIEKIRAVAVDVPESTWFALSAASALSSTFLFTATEKKTLATVLGLLAPAFLAAGFYKKNGGEFVKPTRNEHAYH